MIQVKTVDKNEATFSDGHKLTWKSEKGSLDLSQLKGEISISSLSLRGYSLFFGEIELKATGPAGSTVEVLILDKEGKLVIGTQVLCEVPDER